MELGLLQKALAKLATDPAVRAAYSNDPIVVGRALGMPEADLIQFASMNRVGLDRMAATLDRKAVRALRHRLPRLAKFLGDDFRHAFLLFQSQTNAPGSTNGEAFALDFAQFVLSRSRDGLYPALIGNSARLDRLHLKLANGRWPMRACLLKGTCHATQVDREGSRKVIVNKRQWVYFAIAIRGFASNRCWCIPIWRQSTRQSIGSMSGSGLSMSVTL